MGKDDGLGKIEVADVRTRYRRTGEDIVNRKWFLIVAFTAVAAATAQAQTSAPSAARPRRVSAVIRIETPRYGGGNQLAAPIIAALTSTELVDPAVESITQLKPRTWQNAIRIEVTPAGDTAVMLTVTAGHDLPEQTAGKLLHELANRTMRSFNVDPVAEDIAQEREKLVAKRGQLDSRLRDLRRELEASYAANSSSDERVRVGYANSTKSRYEQELANSQEQTASSKATIDDVDQQLKELDVEHHAELRELSVRLISQRSNARGRRF